MQRAAIYIHGRGGDAREAEHYRPLLQAYDVMGLDYKAQSPWETEEEFPPLVNPLFEMHDSVILIANSIGAYFAMHALADQQIDKAFLISPIVDMEGLIARMMSQAGVTEDELRSRREIPLASSETLSWAYLRYVRAHPLNWHIPTEVLCGERDDVTPYESLSAFANQTGARLTVMRGGEHWFHTDEQMAFLDSWLVRSL